MKIVGKEEREEGEEKIVGWRVKKKKKPLTSNCFQHSRKEKYAPEVIWPKFRHMAACIYDYNIGPHEGLGVSTRHDLSAARGKLSQWRMATIVSNWWNEVRPKGLRCGGGDKWVEQIEAAVTVSGQVKCKVSCLMIKQSSSNACN